MPQKTLAEWLELLEARHPTEIELGLERIGRVASRLGLLPSIEDTFDHPVGAHEAPSPSLTAPRSFKNVPPKKVLSKKVLAKKVPAKKVSPGKKVISVAGTNGKGSCVAAIESILLANGYRVGAYTSPHFIQYNERVRINGHPISDEVLCQAFERIDNVRGDISLSYFEFGTLAALLIMADSELDVAILEVGLGGRLDAVNIIDADIAIVTSIALDHQDWLGHDLNQIAMEKAAIGRAGKPLIYGDEVPVQGVLDSTIQTGATLLLNGRDFSLNEFGVTDQTPLPPASVACAIQTARLIDDQLSIRDIERGLTQVQLQGRFQQINVNGVNLILDVAHNPQAAELLARRLSYRDGKVIAVAGMMSDKDIPAMLKPMLSYIRAWCFCDIPRQNRAAKASNLKALLYNVLTDFGEEDGLAAEHASIAEFSSPVDAVKAALSRADTDDTVLVFGSFFTVGPVLNWLNERGVS